MPDGKAFTIVNHKKFAKEEMPKIFNIQNMSSFVRKLTRFGFVRVHDKKTMNSDIFSHQDFQRGSPEKAAGIKYGPKSHTPRPSALPPQSRLAVCSQAMTSAFTSVGSIPKGLSPISTTYVQGRQPTATSCEFPICPSRTHPHRVSLSDNCTSNTNLAGSDHLPGKAGPIHSMKSPNIAICLPESPSSSANAIVDGDTLRAAIDSLLRERESLRMDADANALALIRLLREQERIRLAGDHQLSQISIEKNQNQLLPSAYHQAHRHHFINQHYHEQLPHVVRQYSQAVHSNDHRHQKQQRQMH
jgi:hypothetical protein